MFLPGRIWIIHAHIAVGFTGSTKTHLNWQAFWCLVLHLSHFEREGSVPPIKYPYWDVLWWVTPLNNWFKSPIVTICDTFHLDVIGRNYTTSYSVKNWYKLTPWSQPKLSIILFWVYFCRIKISLWSVSILKTKNSISRKTVSIENAATNDPRYLDTLLHMEVLLFLAVLLRQNLNVSIDVGAKMIQCLRKLLKFLFTLHHFLSTQKTWVLHGCQTWLFYHWAYKYWKSRGGITHRFHKKQNLCLCNFIWLKDKHRCCICR